jgi:nitrogen regulatory protein PII
MRRIVAVVQPFRAQAVLQAIAELGIEACTVCEAKGYGRQKGYLDRYAGSEYSQAFLPKVEITLWVPDGLERKVVDRIVQAARTGRIGDGKILVQPVAEVIDI